MCSSFCRFDWKCSYMKSEIGKGDSQGELHRRQGSWDFLLLLVVIFTVHRHVPITFSINLTKSMQHLMCAVPVMAYINCYSHKYLKQKYDEMKWIHCSNKINKQKKTIVFECQNLLSFFSQQNLQKKTFCYAITKFWTKKN